MEKNTDTLLLSEEIPGLEDMLTAGRALFDAMGRFYLYNRPMLRTKCPRMMLLNRIAGCLEVELERQGIGDLYAADMIDLSGELNLGIRGRRQAKNLVLLEFLTGFPRTDHLAECCGSRPESYRFGICITLNRNYYLTDWFVPAGKLHHELEGYFFDWMNRAFFLGPNPRARYLHRQRKITW